jgi:hypothetical protein
MVLLQNQMEVKWDITPRRAQKETVNSLVQGSGYHNYSTLSTVLHH